MIVPQPEDLTLADKMGLDFNSRYAHMFENFSPILPLHFDKAYLPSICYVTSRKPLREGTGGPVRVHRVQVPR